MMPLNRNGARRAILSIIMVFNLIACASYPDSPRKPQAGNDRYTVAEDTLLNISQEDGILGNDQAKEGTDLILVTTGRLSTSQGGIVNMALNGGFIYYPPENYFGNDQCSYTIRNQKGKETEGTITFEVIAVNDRPDPANDNAKTDENETVDIFVLANDDDIDGDDLAVVAVDIDTDYGIVQIIGDGTLRYTPRANHSGEITFSYTVADGNGGTASATVFVTIENIDAGIRVGPDQFETPEDQPIVIMSDELLENDDDLENGDPLTITGIGDIVEPGVDEDDRGSLDFVAGTAIRYTPAENFSGNATFTYTVRSRSGSTASGTATVNVTEVADPPQISDIRDREIIQGNDTGFIEFTISDVDTALADLEVSYQVSASNPADLIPADGGITIDSGSTATQTILVTPAPDLFGSATITVTVSDGESRDSTSFRLTVAAANQGPTISNVDNQTTTANTPITVGFTVADDQTPAQDLRISTASTNTTLVPDGNIVPGNGSGSNRLIVITPAADQTGTTTITITVTDGALENSTSFQLTVDALPNTAPTISAIDSQDMLQGTTIDVPFTIGDAESDPSTLDVTATPADTTLVLDISVSDTGAERILTITSAADQIGTTQINIEVSDGVDTTLRSFSLEVRADDGQTGDAPTEPDGVIISLYSSRTPLSLSSADSTNAGGALLAQDDIYSTAANQPLTVAMEAGLLANDRAAAQDQTLVISPVNQTSLTLYADGGFSYRPPAGFTGRHSFEYVVSDGSQTAGASVTIIVGGNQVPQARQDNYAAVSGRACDIDAGVGLLANDADPDNDPLTVISTGVFDTQSGGEVNIGPRGEFNYMSPAGFNGDDSFAYTVSDGQDSAVGIAVINVAP